MAGTVEEVSADGIGQKSQVFLSTATIEKAQELTYQAGTGWDFYVIEQQFYEYIKAKGTPDNIDAAFIGFVRKKIMHCP